MFAPPLTIGRNSPSKPISPQLSKVASLTNCFRYSSRAKFRQLERFLYAITRNDKAGGRARPPTAVGERGRILHRSPAGSAGCDKHTEGAGGSGTRIVRRRKLQQYAH